MTVPADATAISDIVIVQPEQFGLVDGEFVPVRLYRVGEEALIGTIDYATEELGLPAVFEDAEIGFVLMLPSALAAGETAEYLIQWGQLVNLGWQESTPVPPPNTWPESNGSSGSLFDSHLDQNERLWRLRRETVQMVPLWGATTNSSLWLEIVDPSDGNVLTRQIEYAPADFYTQTDPNDPSDVRFAGTWRTFLGGSFIETDKELWVFWSTQESEISYWPRLSQNAQAFAFQRFNKTTLQPIGNPVYTEFVEGDSYAGATRAPNGETWLLGTANDDSLFYSRISPAGSIIEHRKPIASHPGGLTDPSFVEIKAPLIAQDGKVWLFYGRDWSASPTNSSGRAQLYLKILYPDGTVFLDETPISPASIDPDVRQSEIRGFNSAPLMDQEGKVWVSFLARSPSGLAHYYSIFNTDGSVLKDKVQTPVPRVFHLLDSDGYIWTSEGDQRFFLNPDDIIAAVWPAGALMPNQSFGLRAAQIGLDSYRVFDRWSTQALQVDVAEIFVSTMVLVNVDKFGQGAHVEDLEIATLGIPFITIPGQLPAVSEIDVSGVLLPGRNTVEFSQDALLGGEILVTFTVSPQPELSISLVRTPTSLSPENEVPKLPANEEWLDEWDSFWAEIWVSTPDSDNVGVSAVSLDLTYNTQYFIAVEVDFTDSAFSENQRGQIDDAAGRVIGISGTTSRSDVGDDRFALLARVRFEPSCNDGIPLNTDGHYVQSVKCLAILTGAIWEE